MKPKVTKRLKLFILGHVVTHTITIVSAYSFHEAIASFTDGAKQPISRFELLAEY